MAPYFPTAGDRLLEALDRGEDPFAQAAEARILRAFNTPANTTTAGPENYSDLIAVNTAAESYVSALAARAGYAQNTREASDKARWARNGFIRENRARYATEDQLLAATAAHLYGLATATAGPARETTKGHHRTRVTESLTLTRPATTTTSTGTAEVLLRIIDAGNGSSGYYSPEVLEQAAKDRVFPATTLIGVDHDTAAQQLDRPEGSLAKIAGHLIEDAYYSAGALYARARINSRWRYLVDDMAEAIGVSINASADLEETATGPVVARLIPSPLNRCDLVTVPGRGGGIASRL